MRCQAFSGTHTLRRAQAPCRPRLGAGVHPASRPIHEPSQFSLGAGSAPRPAQEINQEEGGSARDQQAKEGAGSVNRGRDGVEISLKPIGSKTPESHPQERSDCIPGEKRPALHPQGASGDAINLAQTIDKSSERNDARTPAREQTLHARESLAMGKALEKGAPPRTPDQPAERVPQRRCDEGDQEERHERKLAPAREQSGRHEKRLPRQRNPDPLGEDATKDSGLAPLLEQRLRDSEVLFERRHEFYTIKRHKG